MKLFFKHDLNARNDPKLLRLRMAHGLEGVGAYWCLVEMMYEQNGKILLDDLDVILFQSQITREMAESMVTIGLFESDGQCLTCSRIVEAIEDRESIREKRREAINKRWHKDTDTFVLQMNADADTNVIQRREDNNREESKEKNSLQSSKRKSAEADPSAPEKENLAALDFRRMADFFNSELRRSGSIIPTIRGIDGQRRSSVQARVREHGKEAFAEAVRKAAASDFLNGRNDRGWVADFDWMVKPNNFVKVLEGNYDNRQQASTINRRYGNSGKHNQGGDGGDPEDGYETTL